LDDFVSLTTVRDGKKKEERRAQDKGWRSEMETFARAIREGGAPPIPYEQLVGVTRATFAAVESIRSQGPVEIL